MASRWRQVVDLIHADSALSGVTYADGRLTTEETNLYPRIDWIWTGGNINADTRHAKGGLDGAGNRNRVVRTDWATGEVHIWGETEESTESLRNALISAGYRIASGSVEFGAYEWRDQTEEGAEWMTTGRTLVMEVSLALPIHAEEKPLTTITGHSHTGKFTSDLDGSEEVVC